MKTVVNEPQAEYKVTGWQTESKESSSDDFILDIKDMTIIFGPPMSSSFIIFSEKPKRKLSALRGRLSKQSKREIDEQLSTLRSEWDRNI